MVRCSGRHAGVQVFRLACRFAGFQVFRLACRFAGDQAWVEALRFSGIQVDVYRCSGQQSAVGIQVLFMLVCRFILILVL